MEKLFDEAALFNALEITESDYRKQVFSSGNSSLVPIWLVDRPDESELNKPDFLQDTLPYIKKGYEIPEKLVGGLVDKPLYMHKNTGRHFFLREELPEDFLAIMHTYCEKVSASEVASCYASGQSYNWQALAKEAAERFNDFDLLSSEDLDRDIQWIESMSEKIYASPKMLDSLDIFSNSHDWKSKYYLYLSSMVLAINFTQNMYPEFSEQDQKTLLATLLYKDIGYARLKPTIADYEVLNPLVSHMIVSEVDDKVSSLTEEMIEAILKHHEFVDESGPLASRKHPEVMPRGASFSVPLAAQISGLCDIFIQLLIKERSSAVAYSLLMGLISPVGALQGKYSKNLIHRFKQYYKKNIRPIAETDSSLAKEKLKDFTQLVVSAFNKKEHANGIDGGKIYRMTHDNDLQFEEEKIIKLLCILKLLSINDSDTATVLYDKFCPCPEEYRAT